MEIEDLEFIESIHEYIYQGVIIPSVSELINFIMPNKYKGIPERILKEKAEWGTRIHQAIENYENGLETALTELEQVTFEQYLKVKEKYNLNVLEQEKMICFEGRYAGRLDMVADVNYYRCLIDIKTTAKLDKEALSWQLGMYKIAYPEPIEKCYCLWLKKGDLGRLVEIIPKTEKEILKVVEKYEQRTMERH